MKLDAKSYIYLSRESRMPVKQPSARELFLLICQLPLCKTLFQRIYCFALETTYKFERHTWANFTPEKDTETSRIITKQINSYYFG